METHRTTPEPETNAIVVVGEDPDTNRILELWLQHLGYPVCVVPNPDDIIEVARAIRPRLVITNYPTPLSAGGTVVEVIRAADELAQTRILSLTSRALPTYIAMAAAAGVDVSLLMPVRLSALTDEIRRLIGPPSS